MASAQNLVPAQPADSSKLSVTTRSRVLITGCSSGFGQLMAETLARKNYHVFATMRAVDDRNANAARAFRSLAQRESLHLGVLELDVTNNESVEGVVDVVIAQTDRIDVLINNAGYVLLGLTEACTLEQAQRIFDTNFFGVVRMNRAVLPHMRRHGSESTNRLGLAEIIGLTPTFQGCAEQIKTT